MLNLLQLFVMKVDVLQFLWGKLMGIPDWQGRFKSPPTLCVSVPKFFELSPI